jgi:hypothetical protein
VAGHRRVLHLDAHCNSALFFKRLLHYPKKNADCGDKPVLPLGRNRKRPCRNPAQLNILEEHTTETTREIGSEAPVQFSPPSDQLIPKVGLPRPEMDVLLMPSGNRGERILVIQMPVDLPFLKQVD